MGIWFMDRDFSKSAYGRNACPNCKVGAFITMNHVMGGWYVKCCACGYKGKSGRTASIAAARWDKEGKDEKKV